MSIFINMKNIKVVSESVKTLHWQRNPALTSYSEDQGPLHALCKLTVPLSGPLKSWLIKLPRKQNEEE